MAMHRIEGWEKRLAESMAQVMSWRYELGRHDCIAMACSAIEALTGEKLFARYFGKYSCEQGAAIQLARAADFERPYLTNAVSNILRLPTENIKLAQRGDIVEWRIEEEPHIGVALHTEAIGFGKNGAYCVPMNQCIHCWKVG